MLQHIGAGTDVYTALIIRNRICHTKEDYFLLISYLSPFQQFSAHANISRCLIQCPIKMRHRDYSSRRVYRLESQDRKRGREDSHDPFREKICRHLDTEWSRCPNSLTQACQNTNYSLGLHCDVPMIPPKRRPACFMVSCGAVGPVS